MHYVASRGHVTFVLQQKSRTTNAQIKEGSHDIIPCLLDLAGRGGGGGAGSRGASKSLRRARSQKPFSSWNPVQPLLELSTPTWLTPGKWFGSTTFTRHVAQN